LIKDAKRMKDDASAGRRLVERTKSGRARS
jgi:hypothetical protein